MKPHAIFNLPNANDPKAVESHQASVLRLFGDVFQDIDNALKEALPIALSTFGLYEGPVDLAVHAPITRYLVRQYLTKRSKESYEQDDVEFDMKRVSNCGLCIKTPYGEIRALKAPSDGLPKASSDARINFSSNNQLVFAFAEETIEALLSLNLFVLWRMDGEFKYSGMDIACPRRARDKGDIDCYWIAQWRGNEGIRLVKPTSPNVGDLDEIKANPQHAEKNLKG